MQRAEKYREYAAGCVRAAQEATSERDKLILLQMAETWMKMAERAERGEGGDGDS
jgi:hypothetical protein